MKGTEELVIAVANMRSSQKKLKKNPTKKDLLMVKMREKRVDILIKKFGYKQMEIGYESNRENS